MLDAIFQGDIVPLFNDEIIAEYEDVLRRSKFHFTPSLVNKYLKSICKLGISSERVKSDEVFPDKDDVVFYEVPLSKEDAYLITGNIKHFPKTPIVVTPAEMIEILLRDKR